MADAPDPAEFLDVQMHQVPGPRPLIALDGDRRLEGAQPRQALAPQDPGDGRGAELQRLGDLGPRPALPAQALHPAVSSGGVAIGLRRGRHERSAKPAVASPAYRATHLRTVRSLTPTAAATPAGRSLLGQHPRHDLASTPGRRPGILMDVHPGLLLCGDGRSRNHQLRSGDPDGQSPDSSQLAGAHRLPTMYQGRLFIEAGGLMSYYPKHEDFWRRSAAYADKILRGAKPADLPVEQPTKFELIINLKTAKALGLTIPQPVLARADEIIE